ncbi:hypothetical protein TRFO_10222 [Tritrichomonas foetus]|uniref:26S proteasome non-ATPase regulatory subunit 5 n=1 Tax=Tritrichomonas foetus TaxID=1144522 RepID=A0A1J4JA53_9EUKA|nr:hypothetical protein TRFO_10222 [Tritrichomonas foetus]|eukprot:OHS96040.1 hypothetical protein TRFO_10222 [Tritrichomonas foetus]
MFYKDESYFSNKLLKNVSKTIYQSLNTFGMEVSKYKSPKEPKNYSFQQLVGVIRNGDIQKIKRNLLILRKETLNILFPYYQEFMALGVGKMFLDLLTNHEIETSSGQVKMNFSEIVMSIITNLCSYPNNMSYAQDLYHLGLFEALSEIINSTTDIQLVHDASIILGNYSTINVELRDKIIQVVPLDCLLNFAISDVFLTKPICSLFINFFKFDVSDIDFRSLFKLFEDLYWEKGTNIVIVVQLFYYLVQIPYFLEYFNRKIDSSQNVIVNHFNPNEKTEKIIKKNVVEDILDMTEANNEKILIPALGFAYSVSELDFSLIEEKVSEYVRLLGSDIVSVAYLTAILIKKIIKEEPSLINPEDYCRIAMLLMKNIKDGDFNSKIQFFKTLCRLTKICDIQSLIIISQNNLTLSILDFIDIDDIDIKDLILDEMLFLADSEMKHSNTKNILTEFLSNGGYEFLQEVSNSDDSILADQAKAFADMFEINLCE